MKKIALLVLIVLSVTNNTKANGIALSNVSVLNNAGNTVKIIEFDLYWNNSWRVASTSNYDGAWVFFKFKDNDGKWKHLNFTGTDISMPAGTTYTIGNSPGSPGVGIFIYRSGLGSGTFNPQNIRAGIQNYPGVYDVRGFAIEMVYIPQGSFYLGDGSYTAGANTFHDGTTSNPHHVTSTTVVFSTAGGGLQPGAAGTLTGYPVGYSSYWIMKYELSQGGYRDFLNTLTYAQQASRMEIAPSSIAGTKLVSSLSDLSLEIATPGVNPSTPAVIDCDADNTNTYNNPGDGINKTMGYLNWLDVAAWLDWAGLRPITEMEYEKACRGPLAAVPLEYAWGNTTLSLTPFTLLLHNYDNSSITNASSTEGNANLADNLANANTPLYRGGIFASAGSSRISSGAGYYGAMELTGNVCEYAVVATNNAGRSYTGRHGDGTLDAFGNADESYWPGINGNNDQTIANTVYSTTTGVTGSAGIFLRGGGYIVGGSQLNTATVSYRLSITNPAAYHNNRLGYMGIRGVRD